MPAATATVSQGARLIHRALGSQHRHQLRSSAEGRAREAPSHDLAERREVGGDAVAGLRAAVGDAETGDHLVEQQQHAALVAEVSEPFEESRLRRHNAHVRGNRLDGDHRHPRRREPEKIARVASRSLNGAVSVSPAVAWVTPGDDGMPNVASPLPAPFAKSESECPW